MRKSPPRFQFLKTRSSPFAVVWASFRLLGNRSVPYAEKSSCPANRGSGGGFVRTPAALSGTTGTACLTPTTLSLAAVHIANASFSLTLPPIANIALTTATLPTATGRRLRALLPNRAKSYRRYLVGVAISNDMLRRGLISEADFSALETAFAEKYRPYFRYEKPCLFPTLLITQTDEGRAKNE